MHGYLELSHLIRRRDFGVVHSILAVHSFNLDINALANRVLQRFPSPRLPSLGQLLFRLPCDSPWVFPDRLNFHVRRTCDPVNNQCRFPNSGGQWEVGVGPGQRCLCGVWLITLTACRGRDGGLPAAHRARGSDAPSSTAGDDYVEVTARLQIKRGTAWSIFARYQRTGEVVWGRKAALSTIGWTTRARSCWWCVRRTIPSWRWNIWPSSCSNQSAGGAGGDVATLGGWRRRILLDGISIAIQSVTGDQVAAK